jgi:hypothetical protein
MAHFLAGCQGNRGPATRLAGRAARPAAWVHGWRSGARVVGGCDGGGDFFEVYATAGSGGGTRELVGVVRLVEGRLAFTPAGACALKRP